MAELVEALAHCLAQEFLSAGLCYPFLPHLRLQGVCGPLGVDTLLQKSDVCICVLGVGTDTLTCNTPRPQSVL